ncbi:hypothetical protein [Candidatus Palauibacter sp.]|uniref:hypothetical protein n=1 Tax=Candidatus Palauibacter sp. TaxID=3101350 RepID=UPI003B5938EF
MTNRLDPSDPEAGETEVVPAESAGSSGTSPTENQFAALMASFRRGPAPNPIAKHITADHIDRAFDITEKGMDAMERDRNESRNYWKFMAVLIVAASLVLVGLLVFSGNAALVSEILPVFGALVVGFVGGFGYGKSRN